MTTETQTKADRQEAAQKAAATRKRNETRQTSQVAGRKAAATRHLNDAVKAAQGVRKDVGAGFSSFGSAAKQARDASVLAGKAVVARLGVGNG